MTTPFLGYPGQVWQAAYQTVSWFAGQLASGSAVVGQTSAALATFETLRNAVAAVDAWQAGQLLAAESSALAAVEALPISIDAPTQAFLTTRSASVAAAASGVAALPPAIDIPGAISNLVAGSPAVSDPGFLDWCAAFSAETAPTGLTASNLPAEATACATAWSTIATAVSSLQGGPVSTAYDTAARQYRVSNFTASLVNGVTSGPFGNSGGTPIGEFVIGVSAIGSAVSAPTMWNQCVALPTILLDSASLATPNALQNQVCGVVRYALTVMSFQVAVFLLTLRQPQLTQVSLAQLRNNETLQDLAARSVGDFEQWRSIVTLNGLTPPYPGIGNAALAGQQLLLPGSSTAIASGAVAPSYAANVLGTDYDFGPINGDMPAWTGDFNLITGLLNFARAIGRRVQTPLGSLVYHSAYGSRIPGEVGAIAGQGEAAKLAAFAQSAINADPRTGKILSCTAQIQPQFLASISATVQPIGSAANPASVNETISPLP